MGAEVVVVVVVRLEGVLHEPDQAARAPGAAAAPGPRALFHVAGHGPGEGQGPSRVRRLRSARVREEGGREGGASPAAAAAAAGRPAEGGAAAERGVGGAGRASARGRAPSQSASPGGARRARRSEIGRAHV